MSNTRPHVYVLVLWHILLGDASRWLFDVGYLFLQWNEVRIYRKLVFPFRRKYFPSISFAGKTISLIETINWKPFSVGYLQRLLLDHWRWGIFAPRVFPRTERWHHSTVFSFDHSSFWRFTESCETCYT